MKKVLLSAGLVAALALSLSYAFPLQGPWVDRAVSGILSRDLGLSLNCRKVVVERWRTIHFDSSVVQSLSGRPWLVTGAGKIRYGRETRVDVQDVLLAADFLKEIPLPFLSAVPSARKTITLKELRLNLTRRQGALTIHLLKCSSNEAVLQGGVRYNGQGLEKANLLAALAEPVFKKFPEAVQSQMIQRQGGWKALRFLLNKNVLTVSGITGPLLKAQWGF